MISAFGVEHGEVSKALLQPRVVNPKHKAGARKAVTRRQLATVKVANKVATLSPQHPTLGVARTLVRATGMI
jgi:hypothetical protein